MRLVGILLLFVLAMPARADLIETGQGIFGGTLTVQGNGFSVGGATNSVSVNPGNSCVGMECRVGYSSGAFGNFSFVLQSTVTYRLNYSVSVTTGSSAAASTFNCFINGNATAGDYGQSQVAYPNAYNTNSLSNGKWGLNNCGGGTVSATDYSSGVLTIGSAQGLSNRLAASGVWGHSCQTQTILQIAQSAMVYKGAGSWTITCSPVAGVGWTHEAILYQVGK